MDADAATAETPAIANSGPVSQSARTAHRGCVVAPHAGVGPLRAWAAPAYAIPAPTAAPKMKSIAIDAALRTPFRPPSQQSPTIHPNNRIAAVYLIKHRNPATNPAVAANPFDSRSIA